MVLTHCFTYVLHMWACSKPSCLSSIFYILALISRVCVCVCIWVWVCACECAVCSLQLVARVSPRITQTGYTNATTLARFEWVRKSSGSFTKRDPKHRGHTHARTQHSPARTRTHKRAHESKEESEPASQADFLGFDNNLNDSHYNTEGHS